jgi:lysylphosphatidylglycerol synthetase-like protein (DUF2156 family)
MNKQNTQKQKKIFKEIIKSMSLFLLVTTLVMYIAVPVFAQDINSALQTIGNKTSLPGYDTTGHANASYEPGANSITSAILYAVDLMKYILGTIGVVMIIFIGVKLITAGKNIEQVSPKMKEALKYVCIGFVVVMVADPMIRQVFFGEQGEVYRSETDIQLAAQRGTEQLRGLYNFFEVFLGSIAVLMIIIYGVRMVSSMGNEEVVKKSQKGIMWSVLGLILVGVSELIVKDIVFPKEGSTISDVNRANQLIINFTNFISGFIAAIAIAMYMYGGVMYVTALGKEDKIGKAKKVLIGATIGLFIAMGAYALVNTFVHIEGAPATGQTQEVSTAQVVP